MRSTINILWIDDKMKEIEYIESLQSSVENALSNKGYKAKFYKYAKADSGLNYLIDHKDIRWDFVLADLNLEEQSKSGIALLLDLRRKRKDHIPFFILYSNEESSTIKKELSNAIIDSESDLSCFSNYSVLPLSRLAPASQVVAFEKCFSAALCKWDEMNAYRGEVLSENFLLEEIAENISKLPKYCKVFSDAYKKSGNEANYGVRVSTIVSIIKDDEVFSAKYSTVCSSWSDIYETRNAVSHTKEFFDSKHQTFCLQNIRSGVIRFENDINNLRKRLIDEIDEIKFFIDTEFPDCDPMKTK